MDRSLIRISLTSLFFLLVLAVGSMASQRPVPKPSPDKPAFSEYKGITLGARSVDVRTKLGEPKEPSDSMDLFIFSSNESAQFFYDATKAVSAIMITYTGDLKGAPMAKDIFGVDVPARDDGMIFKMERYPKAGYWISYTRTSGTDAMVNIAIQKL